MSSGFFDNNANYPISNEVLVDYARGCKMGNVGCRTKMAEIGRKLIESFTNFIENEFSDHANPHSTYKAIITSGGSESNSTVINHYLYKTKILNGIRPHFVCSTVEHPSITEYLIKLEEDDVADINWIQPKYNGGVPIENIIAAVNNNTTCVFLQSVNSETGCVQNIAGLQIALKQMGVPFHVDHVQGYRKTRYPVGVGDTISLSLHKIGAPLGIGVLLYKGDLHPMIAGKQNSGKRGGTYNIGTITAASKVLQTFSMREMKVYKQFFLKELSKYYQIIIPSSELRAHPSAKLDQIKISDNPTVLLFSDEQCLSHTLFLTIFLNRKPLCGKAVKEYMFQHGYTIATGTACGNEPGIKVEARGSMLSSDIPEPFKVGFLRISFGNNINEKILRQFAKQFKHLNQEFARFVN